MVAMRTPGLELGLRFFHAPYSFSLPFNYIIFYFSFTAHFVVLFPPIRGNMA